MEQLKRELRERYLSTYKECKKINYKPRIFLDMVVSIDDIVEMTRRLIHKKEGTEGFFILAEKKRLDLSVENIILEQRYRVLFNRDDLLAAYNRLEQHGYKRLNEIQEP